MTVRVESIVDPDAFSEWFGMCTSSARTQFMEQLQQWTRDPTTLLQKSQRIAQVQRAFRADPSFYPACRTHLDAIATMEPDLMGLAKGPRSDAEKESYGELLFFTPFFQSLNFVPLFLNLWAALRVYLLPGISFLFPILTLLAPYFLLKILFHLPITFRNYMHILHSMISGQLPTVSDTSLHAAEQGIGISPVALVKQIGVVMLTLVQGVVQPYWSYQHLRSIDRLLETQGDRLLAFRDHYRALSAELQSRGFTFFRCPLPEFPTNRVATAHLLLNGIYLRLAMKQIGRLEVLLSLAHHPDVQPVHWVQSSTPVFRIQHTYDYQVPSASRQCISAVFDKAHGAHAVLTGPNKGGKSTVLRALSVSSLLAHTYGCSIGSLTATPFVALHVCLKPDDLPGSKSRFEREIEFTAQTLKRSASGPALIFIDELYHSTNPPDALRSCEIYSDALWNMTDRVSVISTHLFEWVAAAPAHVQRLCCPADHCPSTGEILFHYTLQSGVCTVSSVDTLLQKNGLAAPERTRKIPQAE